ncbi:MAG: hypothetical protein QFC55_08715 [Chloroflexota bacterium]|nr:hypothetical protein [Chloroflexota bacterium]
MRIGLVTLAVGMALTWLLSGPATIAGRCLMEMQLPCDWFGFDLWRVNPDWLESIADYPGILVLPVVAPITASVGVALVFMRRAASAFRHSHHDYGAA